MRNFIKLWNDRHIKWKCYLWIGFQESENGSVLEISARISSFDLHPLIKESLHISLLNEKQDIQFSLFNKNWYSLDCRFWWTCSIFQWTHLEQRNCNQFIKIKTKYHKSNWTSYEAIFALILIYPSCRKKLFEKLQTCWIFIYRRNPEFENGRTEESLPLNTVH